MYSLWGANAEKLTEVVALFQLEDRSALLSKLNSLTESNEGITQLIQFFEDIDALDPELKVELDVSLARGLSYYTGMIYEVKPTSVKMGSICGGGRYDNLTGVFGLPNISGIGISFGLDRIYDVMEELQLFPENITKSIEVLIVHFSDKNLRHGYQVVSKLRQHGIKADLYPEVAKIRKQFDYADKIDAPYTLIIGDNEMESGSYMLKNMDTGTQNPWSLDEIISQIKG